MSSIDSDQPLTPEIIEGWRARIRAETLSQYQFHMGRAIERTDGAAAVAWYRRALEFQRDHPGAALHLRDLLRSSGDDQAADALHRSALDGNPDYEAVAAAQDIGTILETGNFDDAVARLLSPDLVTKGAEEHLVDTALRTAPSLMARSRLPEAIQIFDLVLSMDPRNLTAATGAAHAELLLMRIEDAAQRLDRHLAIHPESIPLKRLRISARLNLGLPVLSDVQQILTAHPGDRQMLRINAQLKLADNDAAAALDGFRNLLQGKSSDTAELIRLHLLCGQALLALGRPGEALVEFQRGDEVADGQDSTSIALIAYAHAVLGNAAASDVAIAQARRALERGADAWALMALSLAARRLGRMDEARDCLERAWRDPYRSRFIMGHFPWAQADLSDPGRSS